jgi:hypothetical protein
MKGDPLVAVITDGMVRFYANYLLGRVEFDDEAPIAAASWPVTVDEDLTGRFWVDADGQVLEITVRPVGPREPLPWQTPQPADAVAAAADADPEAWAYL